MYFKQNKGKKRRKSLFQAKENISYHIICATTATYVGQLSTCLFRMHQSTCKCMPFVRHKLRIQFPFDCIPCMNIEYWILLLLKSSRYGRCVNVWIFFFIQFNGCLFNFEIVEKTMPLTSKKYKNKNRTQKIHRNYTSLLYVFMFAHMLTAMHTAHTHSSMPIESLQRHK